MLRASISGVRGQRDDQTDEGLSHKGSIIYKCKGRIIYFSISMVGIDYIAN